MPLFSDHELFARLAPGNQAIREWTVDLPFFP